MNQKEIKKKVEDMLQMLFTLRELKEAESKDPENKEKLSVMGDKISSSLLEILVYGIISKDLVQEMDLNEELNIAFHEVGYHNGINEEYKRRCNVCMKKLNKKL